jgi:hypothetical protein
MGKKESAVMTGEEYLKGRRAGVEGTYGAARKGVAEKTLLPHSDVNDSGGESELNDKARSIYQKSVSNGGGKDTGGDAALRDR